jgi:hypothetical protein
VGKWLYASRLRAFRRDAHQIHYAVSRAMQWILKNCFGRPILCSRASVGRCRSNAWLANAFGVGYLR